MTDIVHGLTYRSGWEPLLPRWTRTVDHPFLLAIFALFFIGILLSIVATPPLAERVSSSGSSVYVIKHVVYGSFALALMFVVSLINPVNARRLSLGLFGIFFVSLLLLPLFGSDYGKGAVRWYSLGFGGIQPSEFLKPCFIMACTWLIAGSQQSGSRWGYLISFLITVFIGVMLMMQPDFAQTILYIFGWSVVYFVSGAALWPLLFLAAAGVVFAVYAYNSFEHIAHRITLFTEGCESPNCQTSIAVDAIQQGGQFGKGIAQGTEKWHLADGHTDFIIAVAAEELGFIAVVAIIALFAFVCLRAIALVKKARDPFIRIAGTGLAAMFSIQAFVHFAVAVSLLPTTGLTLPLISYGGSSMVATGLTLGLLLVLIREAKEQQDEVAGLNAQSGRI
ncbi:MAG: FtsW/RodA/SpoVE family cell cycle protein [Rhodobacteraceae bacterium]|nr:FtsW/RodA/SpoVE family cell cycle protein [Paracoccaceae bacterium]MCY4197593.1 FtsW/RodA/SpoVE family cell cycle protein [Paracoccaceae bacterium]